jgi:ribosome-binding factor A
VKKLNIMATGRRISRVSELIKREISQMLLFGIKDERIGTGMVSVTDVDVSGDLQHAKIFVSIYGTDEARAATMEGLQSACGYIRGQLGKRVNLRRTPELSFEEDRSLERGMRVINLIEQLAQDRPAEVPETEEGAEVPDAEELEV